MKSVPNGYAEQLRSLIKRALMAYSGAVGIGALAIVISITHGSGWKPALAGMPLYVILFAGITCQLVKEWRALKRKDQNREKSINSKDQ